MLLSCAFCAEPRFGIAPFTYANIVRARSHAARSRTGLGMAASWAEVIIGLAILFGVYVRFFAAVLIGFGARLAPGGTARRFSAMPSP